MIEEKNDNSTTIMIPSLYHPFKPAFDGTKKDKKNNNDCSDATPELCLPSIASDTIHHGLFSNDKKKKMTELILIVLMTLTSYGTPSPVVPTVNPNCL